MIKKYNRRAPLIGLRYVIILFESPNELQGQFPNAEFSHDIEGFDGAVFKFQDAYFLALSLDKDVPPGTIAHESKHLTNKIFKDIGQNLDTDNDELECYYLEYIVNEVHKCIKMFKDAQKED